MNSPQSNSTLRRRPSPLVAVLAVFLVLLGLLGLLAVTSSPPASAVVGNKALVLESSVTGGSTSLEAMRAADLGFSPVDVVDDETWGSMTAAQFAEYRLIIVGDPFCGPVSQVVTDNAQALADAVMARAGGNANVGNRILIGTDPVFHQSQGGNALIDAGIEFAGVQEGASGLYLDTSCNSSFGGPDVVGELLPLLTIATSNWTNNASPPCGGAASLISNADQFSTLQSSDLQGWNCSVHESFPTFPTDWAPLAVATDTPTQPTCGTDVDTDETACGEAYILIAGSGIVVEAPNIDMDPPTATNAVGTNHTVTATVTNPDDSPLSGQHVDFVVTGANAGAAGTCVPASCDTDSSGEVTFTYTGTNAGDDTINASFTVEGSTQTATAAKTWTEAQEDGVGTTSARGTDPDAVLTGDGTVEAQYSAITNCDEAQSTRPFYVRWTEGTTSHLFKKDPGADTSTCVTEGGTKVNEGTATGTINGTPGATVEWSFVDGVPSPDNVNITVTPAGGGDVLDVAGAPEPLSGSPGGVWARETSPWPAGGGA